MFYAMNKLRPQSTYVHRRVPAAKPTALLSLSLSILRIFSNPKKGAVKNFCFFTAPLLLLTV